jgi:hypothetical protein
MGGGGDAQPDVPLAVPARQTAPKAVRNASLYGPPQPVRAGRRGRDHPRDVTLLYSVTVLTSVPGPMSFCINWI